MIRSSKRNDLLPFFPQSIATNERFPDKFPSITCPAHPTHHSFVKQALSFQNSSDSNSSGKSKQTNHPYKWDRLLQKILFSKLGNLAKGQIEVRTNLGSTFLGKNVGKGGVNRDVIVVEVHNWNFFRKVVVGGTIGAAESYMDGDWSCSDLTELIHIMISNLETMNQIDKSTGFLKYFADLIFHKLRFNSKKNSRRNIKQHYDVGNEFYKLFLDPTLNYSAGIFPTDSSTIEEASMNKMDILCRKLQLTSSDHVIEIGTGWGALAAFMAANYGCRVTTTTISDQQYRLAKRRIHGLGLQDRVKLLKKDYRDLPDHCGTGVFDKLVSVEMIEAVGHQYYDSFFSVCNQLLKPDGQMLLQAITIGDQHYKQHIASVDFISRYIFPGGSLPSIGAMCDSIGRKTQMRPVHIEDLTQHYERTLVKWRDKFFGNISEIKQLNYPKRFLRMWHYYLCYCEAAFASKRVHSVHVLCSKPNSAF